MTEKTKECPPLSDMYAWFVYKGVRKFWASSQFNRIEEALSSNLFFTIPDSFDKPYIKIEDGIIKNFTVTCIRRYPDQLHDNKYQDVKVRINYIFDPSKTMAHRVTVKVIP